MQNEGRSKKQRTQTHVPSPTYSLQKHLESTPLIATQPKLPHPLQPTATITHHPLAVPPKMRTEPREQAPSRKKREQRGGGQLYQLVTATTSAADKVMRTVLPYELAEVDPQVSNYYLNREKLFNYLANGRSDSSARGSKKKEKRKKQKEGTDLRQLDRLTGIVNNRVIPLLEADWRVKDGRRRKETPERRDLLERASRRQVGFEDYSLLIEAFIGRVTQREEKMNDQLMVLQKQLQTQMKKCEELMRQMNEHKQKPEKQHTVKQYESKKIEKYRQFVRQLQGSVNAHPEEGEEEEKSMVEIVQKVRKLRGDEKKKTKCEHASRQVHSACREESSRHQQQIRHLKQVIKGLDAELAVVRESHEQLEGRLQTGSQKIIRLEHKSSKLATEKSDMEQVVDNLTEENRYQAKLIEEYVRIIGKMEESLKASEEAIIHLTDENQGQADTIQRHTQQQGEYLRALAQMEHREKVSQQILAGSEAHIGQVMKAMETRQRQLEEMAKANQELREQRKRKAEEDIIRQKEIQNMQMQLKQTHQNFNKLKQSKPKQQSVEKKQISIAFSDYRVSSIEHKESAAEADQRRIEDLQMTIEKLVEQNQQLRQARVIPSMASQEPSNPNDQTLNPDEREELMRLRVIIKERQALKDLIELPRDAELVIDSYRKSENRSKEDSDKPKDKERKEVLLEQPQYPIVEQVSMMPQKYSRSLEEDLRNNNPDTDRSNKQPESEKARQASGQLSKEGEMKSAPPDMEKFTEDPKSYKDLDSLMKIEDSALARQLQQHQKIRHLLQINTKLSKSLETMQQNAEEGKDSKTEVENLRRQLNEMGNVLHRCQQQTLSKLKRLRSLQMGKEQAQNEVEKLRNRLEQLPAIQFISDIRENPDSSGFTIPEHLQSFFKAPIFGKTGRSKEMKEATTQTEVKNSEPVVLESEVVAHDDMKQQVQTPVVRLEIPQTRNNKFTSLIERLDSGNMDDTPSKENTSEPKQQKGNAEVSPVAKTPNKKADQKSPSKLETLEEMVEYHERQLLSLQKLIKAQQVLPSTPVKTPLVEKEEFIEQVGKAPVKVEKEDSSAKQQAEKEQMKEMFNQRERELEVYINQKEEQVERLKSIIKTLTKSQHLEGGSSVRGSRNRDSHRELQKLRQQNEELWASLAKEKSNNQKLNRILSVQSNSQPVSKFNCDDSPTKNRQQSSEGIALQSKTHIENKAQIYHMAGVEPIISLKQHPAPLDEIELERSRTHSANSVDLPSEEDAVRVEEQSPHKVEADAPVLQRVLDEQMVQKAQVKVQSEEGMTVPVCMVSLPEEKHGQQDEQAKRNEQIRSVMTSKMVEMVDSKSQTPSKRFLRQSHHSSEHMSDPRQRRHTTPAFSKERMMGNRVYKYETDVKYPQGKKLRRSRSQDSSRRPKGK